MLSRHGRSDRPDAGRRRRHRASGPVGVPRCVEARAPRLSRGFSLVEMLIALTVLGILAAVAVPTFLRDDPAADVRHAADRLANVLRQARFRAVSLKRPVQVEFEPGGADDFYTAYADHDGDGDVDGVPAEVEATRITFPDRTGGVPGVALPDDIRFDRGAAVSSPDGDASAPGSAVDLPTNPIVFRPRGTVEWPDGATEPSGGLYLSHAENPEFVHAVVLMPTGAVKRWRLHDGDWR